MSTDGLRVGCLRSRSLCSLGGDKHVLREAAATTVGNKDTNFLISPRGHPKAPRLNLSLLRRSAPPFAAAAEYSNESWRLFCRCYHVIPSLSPF